MKSLNGQSALVIGAGSGIGRATVLALAREGANITAVGRDAARLEAVRAEAPPGSVTARALDATDATAVRRLLEETDPDLVVQSAGVRPRTVPITEYTWEGFCEPWNTDLKIAFELG